MAHAIEEVADFIANKYKDYTVGENGDDVLGVKIYDNKNRVQIP